MINDSYSRIEILEKMKFETMSPVQQITLPHFLGNKDVAVQSKTGSGKTLAYVLPLIQIILKKKCVNPMSVLGVIIAPTKELVVQIKNVIEPYSKVLKWDNCVQVVTGGEKDWKNWMKRKENCSIIVATPGALYQLLRKKCLSFKDLEILIFDEADKLLNMGFASAIDGILSNLPKQRRTGLFSATLNEATEELVRTGLRNPIKIVLKETSNTPETLSLDYIVTDTKFLHLCQFLDDHKDEKIILYFCTCACVDYYGKLLMNFCDSKFFFMHGKMSLNKRQSIWSCVFLTSEMLDNFTNQGGCLVSTDVLARGIDVPDVDWVLQYDPPQDPAVFLHRVGRTARMGKQGRSLLFLLESEIAYVEYLKLNKVPLAQTEFEPRNIPLQDIYSLIQQDRHLYDKGLVAFVSFLRSYTEHRLKFIFRVKDLDVNVVALGFFLIHLPKTPELRGKQWSCPIKIDHQLISYADKDQEEKRQKLLKNPVKKEKPKKRTRNDALTDQDLDELALETRMMKKLKKGKITREVFNEIVDDE